ncbi:MAG: orotate phosphoribosyltransferase [Bryobacteraceae bacterium]
MHLLPNQDEIVRVLLETGALRYGNFEYPTGLRSNQFVQLPLAMRHYQHAKMFGVGISRLLRANAEIRALIPQLSLVAPTSAGLPIAYSICEALRARQVYWAESDDTGAPIHFRQYLEPKHGECVVMVDDILRSGRKFRDLKGLLETHGAKVIGVAVIIYEPTPETVDLGDLPLYYLAKLEAKYYTDHQPTESEAIPPEEVWF